ncbi:MAG: hypothetical protein AAGK04_11250 [Planctomycetota bacterium]
MTHRAFSLVEMLASLTILSFAFGALLSASMLLTSVADPKGLNGAVAEVSTIAADLAEELQTATAITADASTLELTVPDRDGDGAEELLRYQWSGVIGDALTLSYNGATAIEVTGPLDEFEVTFETESPAIDSELLVGSYAPSTIASPGTVRMDNWNWHAQTFLPALPTGATGWKPTRSRFICNNVSGFTTLFDTLYTSINTVNPDGTPTLTAHTFDTIGRNDPPTSMAWFESTYSSFAPTIPAGDEVAFLVATISGNIDLDIQVNTAAGVPAGYSTGNSMGYTADSSLALIYEVYGIVYGAAPRYAQRAQIRIAPLNTDHAAIEFGVSTLNEPLVSGTAGDIVGVSR